VAAAKDANPEILRYLNRLSDLCWILARYAEKRISRARTVLIATAIGRYN